MSSTVPVGGSATVTFSAVSGIASASTTIGLYVLSQPQLTVGVNVASSGEIGSALVSISTLGSSGGSSYNIWVADGNNYRVAEFNSSGAYVSQLGCASGACSYGATNGEFGIAGPSYVAVDSNGNIYVVDQTNSRVEKFNSSGAYVSQLGCASGACSTGFANGQFGYQIRGVAVDSNGNVYVSDTSNNRVEKFNSSGTYVSQLGCASGVCSPTGSGNGQFNSPTGLAVDSSNNVYVIDSLNNRVEEFNSSGAYVSQLGCASGACSTGSGNGQFNIPRSVGVDSNGNIYVGDSGNVRIEEFNSSGSYVIQFGCASGFCYGGSANGEFGVNGFIYGIAVDSSGNVYATDQDNNRVAEFNSSGAYVSQLGCASGACSTGSGNGQFYYPVGIAIH